MDVETAIKELTDEYEEVKSRINLRADEAYVQVINGYRGMSTRRNQLESERNSIVSFIEQVVKEKEKVFMEAFQKVDSDIRATFEKMTGGLAWLEIENSEDIFSSGVMLLVRFPGKTVPVNQPRCQVAKRQSLPLCSCLLSSRSNRRHFT